MPCVEICSSKKTILPHGRFLFCPPPRKKCIASYFASKILAFKTPSPKNFQWLAMGWVMDFYWSYTMQCNDLCWIHVSSLRRIQFCVLYSLFLSTYFYNFSLSGSVVYEKLCSALTNNSLVKGIKQASPFAQTSCLEGFHSLLNQFAPKMVAYSYAGMYCR